MRKKSITRTTRFPIVLAALTNIKIGRAGFRLVRDIIHWFFYLQFETRHRKNRPVVNVDHPLDETIPFRPKDVKKYMTFIPLWMRSISFYRKAAGWKGTARVVEFLEELRLLYCDAGYVCSKCSSTTRRPGPGLNPTFLLIHLTDPHLHCIPSLHVAVVMFNFMKMRAFLTEAASMPGEFDDDIEFCRREAVEIIDTILTVKQHSINCVAAGLYFLHSYHPDFTAEECRDVIKKLLSSVDEEFSALGEIREYTLDLFEWFLRKNEEADKRETGTTADCREIIVDFLKSYEAGDLEIKGVADGRNKA